MFCLLLTTECLTAPMPKQASELLNTPNTGNNRNPNVCAGVTGIGRAQNLPPCTFDETHNEQRQLTGNVLLALTLN